VAKKLLTFPLLLLLPLPLHQLLLKLLLALLLPLPALLALLLMLLLPLRSNFYFLSFNKKADASRLFYVCRFIS
jgi:hypothetical protein